MGTLAHNTEYPYVSAKITELGFSNVKSNNGMFSADGSMKVSNKRPDWQTSTENELLIWEMKPDNISQALKDIAFYLSHARDVGVVAEAGSALGVIAERVPIKGLDNIFMDIQSPLPGVVIYNAYTIKPDSELKQI